MTTVDNSVIQPEIKNEPSLTLPFHWIDRLWHGLMQPWLPLLVIIPLLLTVLAAFILPQMPAQLSADPAIAARWLSTIAANYGVFGRALAGFGLFYAMNSLLWRLLTVLLGFLLALHLLRLWLFDRQITAAIQRLSWSENPVESTFSQPLNLPEYPPLQRKRFAVAQPLTATYAQISEQLRSSFATVQLWSQSRSNTDEDGVSEDKSIVEGRVLALRGRSELRLRMVLLMGGLLATAALWSVNTVGWRLQTANLAPLDRFRDDVHNVAIEFSMNKDVPTVIVQQGKIRTELPIADATAVQRLDTIRTIAGPPALLIQSLSPAAELRRPDGASSNSVGFLFPTAGSEETLILPQQETVLRIVRRTDAAPLTFSFETLQAAAGEINRFTIEADETRTLTLGTAEIKLRFLPLYSRSVEVTSLPGLWLLGPAALLSVVGLFGLRRKPGFVLVQVAAWPMERSVVVVQGSEGEIGNNNKLRLPV